MLAFAVITHEELIVKTCPKADFLNFLEDKTKLKVCVIVSFLRRTLLTRGKCFLLVVVAYCHHGTPM